MRHYSKLSLYTKDFRTAIKTNILLNIFHEMEYHVEIGWSFWLAFILVI